jgi:fumarate reductase flavoprotein subunit
LKRRRTDILILGSGGAGLFAALHAKKAAPGLTVLVEESAGEVGDDRRGSNGSFGCFDG